MSYREMPSQEDLLRMLDEAEKEKQASANRVSLLEFELREAQLDLELYKSKEEPKTITTIDVSDMTLDEAFETIYEFGETKNFQEETWDDLEKVSLPITKSRLRTSLPLIFFICSALSMCLAITAIFFGSATYTFIAMLFSFAFMVFAYF